MGFNSGFKGLKKRKCLAQILVFVLYLNILTYILLDPNLLVYLLGSSKEASSFAFGG